ncbi:adenosine deaminase [Streptomonospora wellingtoniae]|uniref:Adenosine deaminase n=1 Tax=Streptomonospora wellingtoniae TaxID=3075544 RepID=A0ABU2KTN1_9ACTN|nr:adenosine deaminase [Streptomonospora sp. DSM 45055]MDT0302646.1 adenosine deaminase [Streptomonospora sp. DSM 45055]
MREIARLPKAHLHVHLESTIRPDTLREIAAANGIEPPGPAPERFAGFRAFADRGARVRACLRRPEDFARIAREFAADEAADGTRYAEVTFSAAAHGERLGDARMPLEAVLSGLAHGSAAHGLHTRLILDHSRRRPVQRARRTLDLALEHPEHVAAIGMAGEESHPLAPFAEVLAQAARAGVHIVHHAGEAGGADAVAEALDTGAVRIGHGIGVLGDAAVVERVRAQGVALEVCCSSNVALGFAPSLQEHPLPRLREAGLSVTLNTDVPDVARTSLTGEYERVRAAFGCSDTEMAAFARTAVAASFAPAQLKRGMEADIDAWLAGGPA